MTDPRRQKFQGYLRDLADRVGLRDWRVLIDDEAPPEDCNARVTLPVGRRVVRVALADRFLENSPEEQRQTLVHELLHAHFDLPWQVALGAMADDALREAFHRAMEYGIDAMAEALAPHMPLHIEPPPPRPGKGGGRS